MKVSNQTVAKRNGRTWAYGSGSSLKPKKNAAKSINHLSSENTKSEANEKCTLARIKNPRDHVLQKKKIGVREDIVVDHDHVLHHVGTRQR